ncbi:MAG: ABC transporter substrate-binding protein [Firmicutes bacterium]|nr:ABC transporter substrate-binding protein [Bacillota bacterium]
MGRTMIKKIMTISLVVILTAVLMAGCGGQTPGPEDKQGEATGGEKVIRISVSGTPKIDPAVGLDYSSSIALVNLYDTLIFPDPDGTNKPHVAEKWEADEDGLNYTFYIRKGIKFHNGNELTAEDVAFSMKRLLTIGEGYSYLFTDVVEDVTVVDDYTVKFTLKKPFGPFVSTLARLYILNKDEVMKNINKDGPYGEMGDYGKEWLITHDAGSGPYIAKELQQQGYLYAVRFDDYWGGWENDAPEAIKLIDNTEGATVRTMLANRELEITDMWQSTENLEAMSRIPGVSIAMYSTGSIQNMMLNTKKPPTDDVNFRKALSYLFDYNLIAKKIFPGSPIAKGPICANTPGHDPNIYQYYLDFEKAKEYLQKSKYGNQLDKYPVELLVNTDVADHEKVALLFQAAAESVGIKVNISKAPWISITEKLSTVETTPNIVCINVPLHYNEAGSMLETRYHSKTTGTWEQGEWLQSSELDALIEDALSTVDKGERFEKYKKIQNLIVNDICPTVWLVELNERCAYQSDYVYWPTAEAGKQGKYVTTLMGYHYYFPHFKIYPEKMNK